MIDIQLKYNNGFPWYSSENIHVKGFLFDNLDQYLTGEAVVDYFKDVSTSQQFEHKIVQANGLFSVIIQLNEQVLAAVDRLRSFPLFYYQQDGNLTISDNANWLRQHFQITDLATSQMQEFRSSGFVSADRTLLQGIFQIQTGAWLSFEGQDTKQIFYHQYHIMKPVEIDFEQATVELDSNIRKSFNRFIESLKGRTVALSLSGGFDSRLIAVMLKEMDYKNVLCYTFGHANSPEVPVAKRTAEALNLPWIFIEHNSEFVGNFLEDPNFENYFKFSANLTSMFFLESYFALRYIKQSNLVPDDAIFICGHSGDFLAGSQLVKNGGIQEKASLEKISKQISKRKYNLLSLSSSSHQELAKQINEQLAAMTSSNQGTLAYSAYRKPTISERHRHRYEFNNKYRQKLENAGVVFSGINTQKKLVEIIEFKDHPFFVGVQFHPEFKSRPLDPHPLYLKWVETMVKQEKQKAKNKKKK